MNVAMLNRPWNPSKAVAEASSTSTVRRPSFANASYARFNMGSALPASSKGTKTGANGSHSSPNATPVEDRESSNQEECCVPSVPDVLFATGNRAICRGVSLFNRRQSFAPVHVPSS
jgi:hypothetical protein